MAYGVIGNTADFGSVVQGSSPCRPTETNDPSQNERDFFWKKNFIIKIQGREACPER